MVMLKLSSQIFFLPVRFFFLNGEDMTLLKLNIPGRMCSFAIEFK